MIVPRTRLLAVVAGSTLPAALLAAADPALAPVAWSIVIATAALAVIDAVLGGNRLDGLGVRVAPVTRFTQGRPGNLEVQIRATRARNLRLALAWPEAFAGSREELDVRATGDDWSRFPWPCQPIRRGRHQLAAARVETASPLGLWSVRQGIALAGDLRVYPDLSGERRNLAAMFPSRGGIGNRAVRQLGQGREFEKLREYVAGDSFDDIHWKATARRGRPVTKVHQVERTQEVYVVIDSSRLSRRPAPVRQPAAAGDGEASDDPAPEENDPGGSGSDGAPASTLERFISAALVFGLAAERQGDHFGLITFSDHVDTFVRASNGRGHYNACRDALFALQPRDVSPDYDELAAFLRVRLRRRSLLVVLTALDDPVLAENFVRDIEIVRRQHLVLVNMLRPPGADPLFTAPDVNSVDDLYDRVAGHGRWARLRELELVLRRRGVAFSLLSQERMALDLVNQYVAVKARQSL